MKILVINGPNINMLGIREVNIYGKDNYQSLTDMLSKYQAENHIVIETFQSNHEGAIVDTIQAALGVYDGIVINPAAYTHTSIAILDALKAVQIPCVEVHISDISTRETFRQLSYVSYVAKKSIIGHGLNGYIEALDYLKDELAEN